MAEIFIGILIFLIALNSIIRMLRIKTETEFLKKLIDNIEVISESNNRLSKMIKDSLQENRELSNYNVLINERNDELVHVVKKLKTRIDKLQ